MNLIPINLQKLFKTVNSDYLACYFMKQLVVCDHNSMPVIFIEWVLTRAMPEWAKECLVTHKEIVAQMH